MGLQAVDQRPAQGRGRRPQAARRGAGVLQQAHRRLGNHLGRAAVAGVAVAGDADLQAAAVGGAADEQHIVVTGLAFGARRAFAGLRAAVGAQALVGRHRQGDGLALVARAGDQHLVIDQIGAPGMAQQVVAAMHIAGVDGGHHKGRHPHAQHLIDHRLVARGLARAFEAGGQRKRVAQQVQHAGLAGGGGQRGFQAGGGAAREGALHLAHPAAHPLRRHAVLLLHGVLQGQHAQVEGDGVETAGEHDARAAGLGGGLMGVDHLAHPGRLATQIDIVHAGLGTGLHQRAAVKLVGADGAEHQPGAGHQRGQAGGVLAVGLHQRGVGRRADLVAHRRQLAQVAAAHGPAQATGRA